MKNIFAIIWQWIFSQKPKWKCKYCHDTGYLNGGLGAECKNCDLSGYWSKKQDEHD